MANLEKLSGISKFQSFDYKIIWQTPVRTKWYQVQLSCLYKAKVIAIPDFFYEFLRIFIKTNSNFKYEVILRTPILTKWYQVQLFSLYIAKVIAIPDFF
jgi:hypothetical protein